MGLRGNYYEVLGLSPEATLDDIKRSYDFLARQLHPDRTQCKETAHKVFLRINQAYRTLIDPEMRARYDADIFGDTSARADQIANDKAEETFLMASPEALKLWAATAYEAYSLGQTSTALELCHRVMRFVEDDWSIYALLGDIASGLGNMTCALDFYRSAQELQPANWVLQEKIGRLMASLECPSPRSGCQRTTQTMARREVLGSDSQPGTLASIHARIACQSRDKMGHRKSPAQGDRLDRDLKRP